MLLAVTPHAAMRAAATPCTWQALMMPLLLMLYAYFTPDVTLCRYDNMSAYMPFSRHALRHMMMLRCLCLLYDAIDAIAATAYAA